MSDPLSVAGTAVGLTSLGIQVCQILVRYLRSAHGRRAEITESLSEVKRLISIFYSLNDILPKFNQTSCTKSTTIRRCLEDSEGKLLELQQLLVKLRGPEQSTNNREKMREAGRTVIYPFRVDTLKSLRHSLRELLENLNLAISMTSLECEVTIHDKIDTMSLAIQDLSFQSNVVNASAQDLCIKMQENLSQLQLLESTIANSFTEIKQQISQAEWAIQDLDSNIAGKLTITESEVVSTRRLVVAMFTEMTRRLDSQSAEISQLGMKISCTQDQAVSLPNGPHTQLTRSQSIARPSRQLITPICDCRHQGSSSGLSFAFWNLKFEFQQQIPEKHYRTCKFFGIDRQTQKRVHAQFPLKLAWLSARMTLACIEWTGGIGRMSLSVSYKNTVPKRSSPVFRELVKTGHGILSSRSAEETIHLLEDAELAILSLYRDRESSPRDLDEDGRCHVRMFIDIFANLNYPWMKRFGWKPSECEELQYRVWNNDSVVAMVLRVLQDLDKMVQTNDVYVNWYWSPFFRFSWGRESPSRRELVSYLAVTQNFDTEWLVHYCLKNDVVSLLDSVPALMDVMNLPLMARAIASRSAVELERCIDNGEETDRRVCGFTTLQLSATWPQGLRTLLATNARNHLDDGYDNRSSFSPLELAIRAKCAESVGILMDAGSRLDFDTVDWLETSSECVMTVARQLFERRSKLIRLAEDHLEHLRYEDTSCVSDDVARLLYDDLLDTGVPVDPALEVEHLYTTVYHCPGLPLARFQIFLEQGFRNHRIHDDLGLTPVMVLHDSLFSINSYFRADLDDYLTTLQHLQEGGFLDESPQDPHNLGLNMTSTGCHYLAALCSFHESRECASIVLPELSQYSARDGCTCWCIPGDEGCSPLGSILKVYTDSNWQDKPSFWQKDLIDALFPLEYDDESIFSCFVRFLTFEALEMTHTCCHFGVLDREDMKLITYDNGLPAYGDLSGDMALVILDHDSSTIHDTRASKVERDNAELLDSLMKDFDRQLQEVEPTLRNLQRFLQGYWRQRMAQVFVVDRNVVSKMKSCLNDVKTYVLPERARCLLPRGFELRLTRR